MEWEYNVAHFDGDELEQGLAGAGSEGWELVSVVTHDVRIPGSPGNLGGTPGVDLALPTLDTVKRVYTLFLKRPRAR